MNRKTLIERLEMFKNDARLIMTISEVQMHIDLLKKDKEDLTEAYESIIDDVYQYDGEGFICWCCGNLENEKHTDKCIVNKAVNYIKKQHV